MKKNLFVLLFLLSLQVGAQSVRYFLQGNRTGSATPYGNNVSVGKYFQAGDVKLWYESYGSGKPVFVFHGGGVGSPYEMGQLIDSLRSLNNYQVIVVSTRGHGRSTLGQKPMSLDQRAIDFAALIKSITQQKATVIGFSDGGYSAMSLAVHNPELIERVVAIGAGTLKAGYMGASANVNDWKKADPNFDLQAQKMMPEYARWQEFATDYMHFWHNTSLGKDFFGKIQCPTLMLSGDEDDHAPLQTVVEAFSMIPNCRLAIIPKAWHTCFLDNFNATWAAIKPFVGEDIKTLKGSNKVSDIHPEKVEKEQLTEATTSWDGSPLPNYPKGKPVLKVLRYTIPAHQRLGLHHHLVMSYGVVERGELTLVSTDGKEKTFHKGEAFVEMVNKSHYGENRSNEPTVVTVFYITQKNVPLAIHDEQKKQ